MTEALQRTETIQKTVADPARSAWVSANAGTGKTYVLVRRVIRQLLTGAAPSSIVCITFTKAAAAEMSTRLLGMLSKWSLSSDEELTAALAELIGEAPPPEALDDARKLFARALESPGGLKIQTIHSFCGSILARFPAEADLPLGFKPLEDDEADALLREAVRVVAEAAPESGRGLDEAVEAISQYLQGEEEDQGGFTPSVEDCLRDFIFRTRGLATLEGKSIGSVVAEVLRYDGETEDDVYQSFSAGRPDGFLAELRAVLPTCGKRPAGIAQKLEACFDLPAEEWLAGPFCLNDKLAPYQPKWIGKKAAERISDFEQRWDDLCDHFTDHLERLRVIRCARENEHFARLAVACAAYYRHLKDQIGGLDYDDLIERTLGLLQAVDGAWVRFKLDEGIDHVLLDEAQDTSAAQWDLFARLVEEIASTDPDAAGEGRMRSIFVVGDPKQSIYAFNGAEAALFAEQRETFGTRLGGRMARESLFLSFRTSQPVLDLVDEAFERDDFAAVSGGYDRHVSHWSERPGSVEVWPHLPVPEKETRVVWDRAVDAVPEESVDRKLALAIADDIARRMEESLKLGCEGGRYARPSDVMILFQRRSQRFREVLRALAERGVPCAGTDRIDVASDVAVRDLINLLRFAANTDDDLSLAVLLKSPFFGWSEDDLFSLCSGRRLGLWQTLKDVSEEEDGPGLPARAAMLRIQNALEAGARRGPYSLMASFLEGGEGSTGRAEIAARLGPGSGEAIEAFLDEAFAHEDAEPRSIHSFLHRAERLRKEIKREIAGEEAAGVRVMTVHGAKGLEAPIVYLADADYRKGNGDYWKREKFVGAPGVLRGAEFPIFAAAASRDLPERVKELRADADERREEEYQRLLYVAATRAAEHLTVCGGKEPSRTALANGGPMTWHWRVQNAMEQLAREGRAEAVATPAGGGLRYALDLPVPREETDAQPVSAQIQDAPSWITVPAPDEHPESVIYPSDLGEDDEEETELEQVGTQGSDARTKGLLVHKLLEVLPDVPEAQRPTVAEGVGFFYKPALTDEEVETAVASACELLGDERFAALFGPEGQAEVSVQGSIDGVTVSGQIDRLLVETDRVTIAEFKSSRWVPSRGSAVPRRHRRQAELYAALIARIYPDRPVSALLVYTAAGRAFEVV